MVVGIYVGIVKVMKNQIPDCGNYFYQGQGRRQRFILGRPSLPPAAAGQFHLEFNTLYSG
jgi:hypothetical protein